MSSDNCLTRNEWICGRYYSSRAGDLTDALVQHLELVVASVLLGLAVAVPLALLARRYRKLEGPIVGLTTAIYTIPSLALFSLMVPLTGLGDLLVDGTRTDFKAQVLATSVLCVLLAVSLDLVLVGVQRLLTPWTRKARSA
jgi:osmoprotectant transport system permease protein